MNVLRPDQASLERLLAEGVLVVDYGRLSAGEAEVMLTELVRDWGRPHHHNGDGQLVWHVRSQRDGRARSQGLDEFSLHTDASFEAPPPRFVALFVVREDRAGGGVSEWVSSRQILARLDARVHEALRQPFAMAVPDEFAKGCSQFEGALLWDDDCVRYRSELLRPLPHQLFAMQALDAALRGPRESRSLQAGTLLLLDNWRMFHGRTAVRDPERHLLRVRFFG